MKIAVYCGASTGNNEAYQKAACEIGKWIGENNHELIYGGGKVGLMGILADEVLFSGGIVTGVMPTFLQEREIAHLNLTKLYVTRDMHERKRKMIDLAEAYVALPGGPGTLEEISEVISWGRIGEHQNPCIFFNQDRYYDLLKAFFQNMVTEGFLTTADFEKIYFCETVAEIEAKIASYKPFQIRRY